MGWIRGVVGWLRRHEAAVVALVAAVALGHALLRGPSTGFNPDENRWLHRAHFLGDLLDPTGPTWDDRYMTRGQPPLGSYVMGIGLLVQGRDLATNPPWDFSLTWERNVLLGHLPPPADLAAGRRTSAAMVAGTAAVVYLLGRWLGGRAAATAGGLAFAVHPFPAYLGSLATADALLMLLLALAAWAAGRFARRPTWGNALLLGGLLGLGGAAKLSPLVLAVGLAGVGGGLVLWRWWRSGRFAGPMHDPLAWGLVALPVVAATVFVAVYPYLWPDPFGRTRALFAFRVGEMAAQSADWPTIAVPTRAEALRRVGATFGEQFAVLDGAVSALGTRFGAAWGAPPIEVVPVVAGLVLMLGLVVARGIRSPAALVCLVLAGQVAITIAGMRSEFDRYHAPMAVLGAVAVGMAGAALGWLLGERQAASLRRGRWASMATPCGRGAERAGSVGPAEPGTNVRPTSSYTGKPVRP